MPNLSEGKVKYHTIDHEQAQDQDHAENKESPSPIRAKWLLKEL